VHFSRLTDTFYFYHEYFFQEKKRKHNIWQLGVEAVDEFRAHARNEVGKSELEG